MKIGLKIKKVFFVITAVISGIVTLVCMVAMVACTVTKIQTHSVNAAEQGILFWFGIAVFSLATVAAVLRVEKIAIKQVR